MNVAPWWRRRYACVEAPVVVGEGRASAALRMFGGATALSRVLRADGSSASVSSAAASGDAAKATGSNELLCFLRPDDEFCHPLRSESRITSPYIRTKALRAGSSDVNPAPSSAPRTLSLLVRVRRPRSGAAASSAASSDGSSAPSRTTGEVLGCIGREFVFRELADMQFVAPARPADAPGAAPMHMTYASARGAGGIAMIPPRFITMRGTQQKYGFTPENAAFMREAKRARGAAKAAGDASGESYGRGGAARLKKKARRTAAPAPIAVPTYLTASVGALALQKRLKELFAARPIWVRNRLVPLLPLTGGRRHDVVSDDLLKFALRVVGTYCRSGPFAHAWIRKGFDPAADAATRAFQTLDFRVPSYAAGALPTVYKSVALGKRSIATAASSSSSSAAAASSAAGEQRAVTVVGLQLRRQNYYQFVDFQARWDDAAAPAAAVGAAATASAISAPSAASAAEERGLNAKLKAVYEGAAVRTQFDEKCGWFDATFIGAARAVIKEHVLERLGVEDPAERSRRERKAAKAAKAERVLESRKLNAEIRAAAAAAATAGPTAGPTAARLQMMPKSETPVTAAPAVEVPIAAPIAAPSPTPRETQAPRAARAPRGGRRKAHATGTAITPTRKSAGVIGLNAAPPAPSSALLAVLHLLPTVADSRSERKFPPLMAAAASAAPAAAAAAPAASAPLAAAPTSVPPAAAAAAAAPELQGFDILGESDEDC